MPDDDNSGLLSPSRNDFIFMDIAAFLIFALSLWKIDVSVSALLAGGYVTNGFLDMAPMKSYHVGVWMLVFSVLWLGYRAIIGEMDRE